MAQTAKSSNNLLMPTPKNLDKALALSADRARRIAEAFGLKVPAIAEKSTSLLNSKAALQRKAKA
jgi:hypothetical protein